MLQRDRFFKLFAPLLILYYVYAMIGQGSTVKLSELSNLNKYKTGYNGYCTIDGVAITQVGNSDEHFFDSKGKTIDHIQPKKVDGRKEANAKRKGQPLKRNGKYIRSTEVRRTVIAWVAAIGGIRNVRFITISFPQGTPDKIAKSVLNIALTRWRKAIPEVSYLWTAERQLNGTLHFHLVTNRYINIRMLNGWIGKSLANKADQIPKWSKERSKRYNGAHLSKEVYSKLGIEKYLAKYLTKAQKSGINQPWHRSREMGQLATKIRFSIDRIHSFMALAQLQAEDKEQEVRIFENDYCLFISWPKGMENHIKYHLNKYNRSRWRGLNQKHKYRFPAQLAVDQKELQLYETKTETGLQQNMLDMFPVTNYQTKGRHRVLASQS